MSHIIIGTAGHIDHGKTALIRALTGCDTDRLAEEKKRGITIELGFAGLPLPDGDVAGIVDVPGHEKFIRNMAAGAWGMDLVLLVIAADEGIMPQTREHMWILGLLGVKHYIIVLNKCDLVDQEWLELVEEDVALSMSGTPLAGAPLIRVSALTGEGIQELREAVIQSAGVIRTEKNQEDAEEKGNERKVGPARLPVDRVFTMPGAGTVATGTVAGGVLKKDDILQVYPGKKQCRVRGVQVYGRDVELCLPGQRGALSLTGVGVDALRRGTVLAVPGSLEPARFFHVRLILLKEAKRQISSRTRLHFYSGTSEILCRAVLLDREILKPGESCYARLEMEEDAVLFMGDHFIVRFYSPLETIGGGVVLETDVFREKRFRSEVIQRLEKRERGDMMNRGEYILSRYGKFTMTPEELGLRLGIERKKAVEVLAELEQQGVVITFHGKEPEGGVRLWHAEWERAFRNKLLKCLKAYLEERRYAPGMPEAELTGRTMERLKRPFAVRYLRALEETKVIQRQSGYVRPFGYMPEQGGVYGMLREYIEEQSAAEVSGLFPLCVSDVGSSFRVREDDVRDSLLAMELKGEIVPVSREIYARPEKLQDIETKIASILDEKGKITISEVRDILGTGRKEARLIMEYTDRIGMTKKEGAESERVRK